MPIINCDKCNKEYDIKIESLWKKWKCSNCWNEFILKLEHNNENHNKKNDSKINNYMDKFNFKYNFKIFIKKVIKIIKWFFIFFILLFIIFLISIYLWSLNSYKQTDFNIPDNFFNTKYWNEDPYSEKNWFELFIKYINRLEWKSLYFDALSKCVIDNYEECEKITSKPIDDIKIREIRKFIINNNSIEKIASKYEFNDGNIDAYNRIIDYNISNINYKIKDENNLDKISFDEIKLKDLWNIDLDILDSYFKWLDYFNKNKNYILEKEFKEFERFVYLNEKTQDKINNKDYILLTPEYSDEYNWENIYWEWKELVYTPLIQYSRWIRYVVYKNFEEWEYDKWVNILLNYQKFIDNLMNKTENYVINTLVYITISKINLESIDYFLSNYDVPENQKIDIFDTLNNDIDEGIIENSLKKEHLINRTIFKYLYDSRFDNNWNLIWYIISWIKYNFLFSLRETELISDIKAYNLIKNKWDIWDFECWFSLYNYIWRAVICNYSANYTTQFNKELDLRNFRQSILNKLLDKKYNNLNKENSYKNFDKSDTLESSNNLENTIEKINYHYSKDKDTIYADWEPIKQIDFWSFEIIHQHYAKDKNNVYTSGKVIKWANPSSFEVIFALYSKDDKNAYFVDRIIDNVDIWTLTVMDYSLYAKDKNNVYFRWEYLEWIDWPSFELINNTYSKDKNNIYYEHKLIEWSDPWSFELINNMYSKDKNNCYKFTEKIPMSFCEDNTYH